MKYFFVAFFLFGSFLAHSQGETDQQLALHYFSSGDFEKAKTYYARIYDNDPSKFNFNRYYECLMQTGDAKEAEKVLKKQIAANRSDLEFKVLLGQFYEQNKESGKAQKLYDDLINELEPDPNAVINLFNAFKLKDKNDLALQTIEKGRKLLKSSYPLNFQFAEL